MDGYQQQPSLFGEDLTLEAEGVTKSEVTIDPHSYDRILVAFSGGKDSIAMVLHLIELGLKDRIELHHHAVDGREGDALFDWPCTDAYVRAVADALGLPLYFSWRIGGLKREMLKENQPTAGIRYEAPDGRVVELESKSKPNTRMMFPQVVADLRTRWCSSLVKIDVLARVISNEDRLLNSRTLVCSGERGQESANRAKYLAGEIYRSDARKLKKRHVDQWRPILSWREEDVWAIIQRHGVVPHPGYQLGWSRLSCMTCIFGDPNQWATIRHLDNSRFDKIRDYEVMFGKTIHRTRSVVESADRGAVYDATMEASEELLRVAMSDSPDWTGGPLVVSPEDWRLPAGAYGHGGGPV